MRFDDASIVLAVGDFQNPANQQALGISDKGMPGWCLSQRKSFLSSPFNLQPVCSATCGKADWFLPLLEAEERNLRSSVTVAVCLSIVNGHQGCGTKRGLRWRTRVAARVARTDEKFSSLPSREAAGGRV